MFDLSPFFFSIRHSKIGEHKQSNNIQASVENDHFLLEFSPWIFRWFFFGNVAFYDRSVISAVIKSPALIFTSLHKKQQKYSARFCAKMLLISSYDNIDKEFIAFLFFSSLCLKIKRVEPVISLSEVLLFQVFIAKIHFLFQLRKKKQPS